MRITLYDLALRTLGIREVPGPVHHPLIQFGFSLCTGYGLETADEVPWCSAWLQVPCWWLDLPRSKSAAARSWLTVGTQIDLSSASVGYDVAVLERGPAPAGHVGLYAGHTPESITLLGGNQSDAVRLTSFPVSRVLAVRRLHQGDTGWHR